MEIKREYYKQMDEELKNKYNSFVGTDPNDVSFRAFTLDE